MSGTPGPGPVRLHGLVTLMHINGTEKVSKLAWEFQLKLVSLALQGGLGSGR